MLPFTENRDQPRNRQVCLTTPFGGPPAPQQLFTVREAITITQETFAFTEAFTGGEVIAKAGTLIGHDGDIEVRTPLDDMMLVMPSKRLWKGQTAVRLAQRDA